MLEHISLPRWIISAKAILRVVQRTGRQEVYEECTGLSGDGDGLHCFVGQLHVLVT